MEEEHRNCSSEEEKLDVSGQVLAVIAGRQLAYLAMFLGVMYGICGPSKARSTGGKAICMSSEGQAVIRAASTSKNSILTLLSKVTGAKMSINSVIGPASEVLVSSGHDVQGHALSMLPLRETKRMIAAKVFASSVLVYSIFASFPADVWICQMSVMCLDVSETCNAIETLLHLDPQKYVQ